MFKSILTAAAITMATLAPAHAGVVEECAKVADLYKIIAKARDTGLSASTAVQLLVENGIDRATATNSVRTIYITLGDQPPEAVRVIALGSCIQAMTN